MCPKAQTPEVMDVIEPQRRVLNKLTTADLGTSSTSCADDGERIKAFTYI